MNSQNWNYLYSERAVPQFNAQPFKVYSTPGLGNFFNDHALYTHVQYFQPNVKEVEKKIESENGEGAFELNPPLIEDALIVSTKKKTKKRKISSSFQKGHGKDDSPSDLEIEEAFKHPIKVVFYTLPTLICFMFCRYRKLISESYPYMQQSSRQRKSRSPPSKHSYPALLRRNKQNLEDKEVALKWLTFNLKF